MHLQFIKNIYLSMYVFIYLLHFVSFFIQFISTIKIGASLGLLRCFNVFEMYFMKSLYAHQGCICYYM